MNYERLSLTGFINEMKDVTQGAHPRKFCFVLGAGTSIDSGIKSGQELVRVWDKELRERNEDEYLRWRNEKGITDENMSSFYSQYYEKRYWRCPADGYNFIEKLMDQASPSVGYVMLAHILTTKPHNVVITTNFDHLTENAISYYTHETPLVIGHEVLAHYVEGQPVRPTIIKIHRDLLFDPKSKEKELEVLPDSWKKALGRIFENYHPIFIGYAGNDKSLMDFLVENGERFKDGSWKFPYWMLYRSDKIEGKVREFLEKSQGFYVEHDGFDDVMIALGANFGYRIPTKDEFLQDAQKRFADLKDAIDAYSARESNKKNKEKENKERNPGGVNSTKQEPEISGDQKEDQNSVAQAINLIAAQSEEQKLFREAMALQNAHQYKESTQILEQLTAKYPKNFRYFSELGHNYRHMKDHENAKAFYLKAISLGETDSFVHDYLGGIYYRENDFDKAEEIFRQLIVNDPEYPFSYLDLGKVYIQKKQYGKALGLLEQYIALDPGWAVPYSYMYDALVALNRKEDALAAIEKAIALDPEKDYYYYDKADVLDALGRTKEASQIRAIGKEKAQK